jgi:hypothetical protein
MSSEPLALRGAVTTAGHGRRDLRSRRYRLAGASGPETRSAQRGSEAGTGESAAVIDKQHSQTALA